MAARLLIIFCLLALGLAPAGAGAATFVVDNLADANDASPGDGVCNNGNGTCSFRAAVQEANAWSGPDRLELAAGTHVLSITSTPSGGSPTLVKPSLATNIEVVGAGIDQTTIFSDKRAGSGMMDVFLNSGENVRFSNLTIEVQTGQHAFEYLDSGLTPPDGLLLENVELLGNSTVPPNCCGDGSLLQAVGSGQITLRRVFVQTQRNAANGWVISAGTTGGLVIEDSTFDGGSQYRIAVLQNLTTSSSGPVTVRDSTFRNFDGAAGFFGAGEAVIRMRLFNKPGTTVIERSTFEDSFRVINVVNEGFDADVTIADSLFTNIGNPVRVSGPALATMTNSTISGAGTGIAVVAPDSGTGQVDMTLTNSTITGSSTSISVVSGAGTLSAQNTIIANGTTECVGTLTSAGHNLVEGSCTIVGDTTGNITGVDPQLDLLADNGGPTLTHALIAGSPAIDAGSAGACPAIDQRGFTRPADGDADTTAICDIGAFEKDAVLVTNQPPMAADDLATVDEDTAVTIDVAANDSDIDGNLEPASANILCGSCSGPASGALVNNGDGTFDYTPAPNFFGADTFVYEICDSDSACDTASVDITVDAVNDPPTAEGDTIATNEDTAASVDLAANDSDVDGNLEPASANISCGTCSGPANGALVNNGDGTFDYTPDPDFFGADTFVYEICDSDSDCDTASVDITVDPVNDAPTFTAGADPSFTAGTSGAQSLPGWPQDVDLGPNETQQVAGYDVSTVANPDGILSGPATISNGGTLAFTLSGTSGVAQLQATLTDDGGTANGGEDTSAPVSFLITVGDAVADLAASSLRCSTLAAPGQAYDYSFVITNNGPSSVAGVMATHTPIPGATVNWISSPDCVDNGAAVDCDLGVLASGTRIQVGIEIQAPNIAAQTLIMSTEALTTSAATDPNSGNNLDETDVEIDPGLISIDDFQSCLPIDD